MCEAPTSNPRFCSRSCATAHANTSSPKRAKKLAVCASCGLEIPGRQKYCSIACQQSLARTVRITTWLDTGVAPAGRDAGHYMKRFLLAEQAGACAVCGLPAEWAGQPLVLVLDHVNGDATDNRRVNLRLVCPNCDSQLPTFKSRNRGRGRHARRQRYQEGLSF